MKNLRHGADVCSDCFSDGLSTLWLQLDVMILESLFSLVVGIITTLMCPEEEGCALPLNAFCLQSKVRLALACDWPGPSNARPPAAPRGLLLLRVVPPPVAQVGLSQSNAFVLFACVCRQFVIVIQHVGYVRLPHVCASDPGPLETQERVNGSHLTGCCGLRSRSVHGYSPARNGERDGRTGSGYPSGATPAAKPGEAVIPLVYSRFSIQHSPILR